MALGLAWNKVWKIRRVLLPGWLRKRAVGAYNRRFARSGKHHGGRMA